MPEHEYSDSGSYEERDSDEYFRNHHPNYYTEWDDYQFARNLNPERFEEYEWDKAIKHNMICPDH